MNNWQRLFIILLLLPITAWGEALQFPQLSGRVVDEANILSPTIEQTLSQQLAQHEQQTTNQVVVVTLSSLQGTTIEDYGYQLGRHWGIGQEGKDNGVLLIVAPNDRKVRIEVGYGLEGVLTDALSSVIIQTRILPAFKSGDMEQGVLLGASAILDVLGGDVEAVEAMQKEAQQDTGDLGFGWIFFVAFAVGQFVRTLTRSRLLSGIAGGGLGFFLGSLFAGTAVAIFLAVALFIFSVAFSFSTPHGYRYRGSGGSSSHWGGGGSGWGGGGGFSGGGGGFGGGGSSGSW